MGALQRSPNALAERRRRLHPTLHRRLRLRFRVGRNAVERSRSLRLAREQFQHLLHQQVVQHWRLVSLLLALRRRRRLGLSALRELHASAQSDDPVQGSSPRLVATRTRLALRSRNALRQRRRRRRHHHVAAEKSHANVALLRLFSRHSRLSSRSLLGDTRDRRRGDGRRIFVARAHVAREHRLRGGRLFRDIRLDALRFHADDHHSRTADRHSSIVERSMENDDTQSGDMHAHRRLVLAHRRHSSARRREFVYARRRVLTVCRRQRGESRLRDVSARLSHARAHTHRRRVLLHL